MHISQISVFRAIVVSTIVIFLVACGQQQAAPESPPPAVIVAPVVYKEITNTIDYIGQTVAVDQVSIQAQVTGYIDEITFKEGDDIKEGAELLVIEQAPFIAQVNQAKASLAVAESNLELAKKNLVRYSELVKEGAASQQTVDRTETDVTSGEANILVRKAELEQAELNLGYTTITAPISGRIGRAEVTRGNLVGPSTGELAHLVQLDPIYVTFSVSEKDLITAKQKMLAEGINLKDKLIPSLRLPNGTMYGETGKIDFVDNTVDPTTGTVAARCVFDNPNKLILPGQFVNIVLEQDKPVKELVVPQVAVLEDQQGRYVLTVDADSKVVEKRITTGDNYGDDWILKDGLKENENVIIYGLQKVTPGITVKATTQQVVPEPVSTTPDKSASTAAPNTESSNTEPDAGSSTEPATDSPEPEANTSSTSG